MRKDPISLVHAVGLFVIGLLLGSVFTFGMQYWNAEVLREDCTLVETHFLSYDEIRGRRGNIRELAINCANEERYFIDGAAINRELRNTLSEMSEHEEITLLIHPNSSIIVEFSTEHCNLLLFEDMIHKLDREATVFLFLGIFMYLSSVVGLYHIVLHVIRRRKAKMRS